MKILFICLDNYPESGACTNILKKIIFEGGLKDRFEEVHVLTRKYRSSQPRTESIDGVIVHRCVAYSALAVDDILSWDGRFLRNYFVGLTTKIIDKLLLRKYFYGKKYAKAVYRELKSIKGIDVIIPVAGFFSSVAAALKLRKEKQFKLITYLVDPCSTNQIFQNGPLSSHEKLEKEFLTRSDYVITTDIIKKELKNKYPDLDFNKVIGREFPVVSPKKVTEVDAKEKKGIVFCYSGRLYANRNTLYLRSLVSAIDTQVKVLFVGATEDQTGIKNDDTFLSLGTKTIEECENYLRNSDFLINLGNSMLNQVPSKLFEYISYGKPIINLCRNSNCPTIDYLKKYPLAINIVEGAEPIEEQAKKLNAFIADNLGKTIDWKEVSARFFDCTPEFFADEFMKLV